MTAMDKEQAMKQRFSIQDLLARTPVGNLNLRGKLTAGNMVITVIVVALMGLYLYLRIQAGSQQLINSVEENARNRAEQDLVNTNREQAAFLDSFFVNMTSNTSIAATTIRSILDDEQLVTSSYWDANSKLLRSPSGSYDNQNTEVSSIFIPAGIPLTNNLANKLNLLKHSELLFPSMLKGNPDIVAIYFGGESKETIYYPNIDLANIVPADFDVTGRGWYLAAKPSNNPKNEVVWSAPYEDAALNGLVITTSAPVVDKIGRFQGVTAIDVQITRVIDLVANVELGETGYAFLVDNNNRLISLPEAGFSDFGITDENAKLSIIMDPTALPTVTLEFTEVMGKINSEKQGVFTTFLNGTERHVTFHDIPQVNYKLVYIIPSNELFSGREIIADQISQETRTTINFSVLLIGAIFILAAAASFTISNSLTAPLQSLNDAAGEIIKGNFNTRVEVNSRDELETLATTLNTMTDTVKDLVSSLEQRVSERTFELQKANLEGEKRGKQYEAIAKVAQAISTQKNLQELLPQITEVISEQFGFYHVGIFLNDAMNKYAQLAAANSAGGKRMLKRGHQLKVGAQGIVGYATGMKRPRIALNVGDDSVYFNNPDLPETRSEVALPLLEAGNVLGALDVQSTEPNAFTDKDLEALNILAELVSIAIQNAKLYEKMDRSLAEAEAASRQFFRENWNRLADEYRIAGYRYTAGGAAPLSAIESADESSPASSDKKQVQVPIIMRGQEIGELSVSIPKNENIKADQMDLIKAVADRVAVIAENARLFDETTRRAERERLVTDITTKIRGTNDPQAMIETAIKELRDALKVSRVEIVPQKNKSMDR